MNAAELTSKLLTSIDKNQAGGSEASDVVAMLVSLEKAKVGNDDVSVISVYDSVTFLIEHLKAIRSELIEMISRDNNPRPIPKS